MLRIFPARRNRIINMPVLAYTGAARKMRRSKGSGNLYSCPNTNTTKESGGVHDRHDFVSAAQEQPAILLIDRQSAWLFAPGKGPALGHRQFVRVEREQLILVFEIHEHRALAVGLREFRFAAEWNRANHFSLLRINRRRILTACVEGEDALRGRVIPDGVGASADFDLVQRLQSLEIEN